MTVASSHSQGKTSWLKDKGHFLKLFPFSPSEKGFSFAQLTMKFYYISQMILTTYHVSNQEWSPPNLNFWNSYELKVHLVQSHIPKGQLKTTSGASLVARWLRISLPMQGTRVRVLVWEDPTCRRLQSNWAREPQLLSLHIWSLWPATGEAAIVRGPRTAMRSGPRLPQLEKALVQKRRPNTAKNK